MVFKSKSEVANKIKALTGEHLSLGFVPTMGALHDGHIALMKTAARENDILAVSIFVNPTQFNNSSDLEKYPRNVDKDIDLIYSNFDKEKTIIYTPDVDDVYSDQVLAKQYTYNGLESKMEGASRPGHFNGVGTILEFLFNLFKPARAYFGEKDFQQLQIVKSLKNQLDLDLEIIGCPISREDSGLARSSRNGRLTDQGWVTASKIFQSLFLAKEMYDSGKYDRIQETIQEIYDKIENLDLEYFTIAREDDLETATPATMPQKGLRAFVVAHVDGVRLIDNMKLS